MKMYQVDVDGQFFIIYRKTNDFIDVFFWL